MAESLGMSQGNYSKIEQGTIDIKMQMLTKICSILEVDLSHLAKSGEKEIYRIHKPNTYPSR
jgi:transcriptional regulator with XRE-family HTH domain